MIKSLYYAYASSEKATKLGFANTGCYYIELIDSEGDKFDMYASEIKNISLIGAENHQNYKWGVYSLYQPTKF